MLVRASRAPMRPHAACFASSVFEKWLTSTLSVYCIAAATATTPAKHQGRKPSRLLWQGPFQHTWRCFQNVFSLEIKRLWFYGCAMLIAAMGWVGRMRTKHWSGSCSISYVGAEHLLLPTRLQEERIQGQLTFTQHHALRDGFQRHLSFPDPLATCADS